MKQIVVVIFIFISCFCIFSCKKEKAEVIDMGYNYFPDQSGHYAVYDVDSFYYDDFTKHTDTFKFQLKEKIQATFLDNENRTTLRLERYVRYYNPLISYSALPWLLRNVWSENLTQTTAERVEENVRYVKLVFPVQQNKTWNGNASNTNNPLDYSFLFTDLSRKIGGITFDSVLQVNQQDEVNLIAKKYYIEKYARNVGLISKQVIDVVSQPSTSLTQAQLQAFYGTPIMQRVTSGTQYTYTINSYGIE
jgi:hypothetical protein